MIELVSAILDLSILFRAGVAVGIGLMTLLASQSGAHD